MAEITVLLHYKSGYSLKIHESRWFNALALRSGKAKAIVGLANKLTRIAWVIVTTNDEFKASCAFKTA